MINEIAMKKKFTLVAIFFLFMICGPVRAQMGTPVDIPVKTGAGTIHYTTYILQPLNLNNRLPSTFKSPQDKFKYNIVLENGSVIEARTRIERMKPCDIITVGKKDKMVIIKPADTKEVWRKASTGRVMRGVPADSCWLFKTIEGRINGYSEYSFDDKEFVTRIQKGDGPLVIFTEQSLKEMIASDEEALLLAERGKLVKAILVYNEKQE